MPAPIAFAPLALKAAKLAAAAALVYAASRRVNPAGPHDADRDAALDRLDDGVALRAGHGGGEARADAAGRWRGALRFGAAGPGLDIDIAGLGRFRLRRLTLGES